MDRRDFLKASTGVSLSLIAGSTYGKTAKKPNLLILHTDEHNFRTLGCYRKILSQEQAFIWGKGVKVDTPNIDWIAENGALCDSFYASTPVCSPSRAAFVSGKYPQNTPVYTNNIPLDDNIVTFAQVLGKNGYATGYAGKWHLDGGGKPQWAPKRKFGFADNRHMFNRGHWKKFKDTPNGPRVAGVTKGKRSYAVNSADEKSFSTDYLADKTIDFINENSEKSFCYMVSFPDPHGPNTVRAPYDTMYEDLDFQMPKTALKSAEGLPSWATKQDNSKQVNKASMGRYFGMVKCIDDNVKKILDCLRKNGILENTIVVFTSDHGDLCYEHARHNKGVPLETSAKVAFVIYNPAKIKAGTVVDEAMSCVDFMPTILSLMSVDSPETEGRDMSVFLRGGKVPSGWNDVAFFRGTGNEKKGWFGAVTKQYKMIYCAGDEPWLYDLKKDPDELINFYNKPAYAKIRKKLAADILAYGKKYKDDRIDDPQVRKQLKNA